MRTGGGGTRPADAGQATASCSGGHPPAPAVFAVRTPAVRTPTLWTATVVLGAAADSQASAVPGTPATQTPAEVSGCGRTAADPQPPLRRHGGTAGCRICLSTLVKWPGRRSQGRTAVRMPGHRTRPGRHREPARPGGHPRPPQGMGDTAAAATLDSRQQDRSPPRNGVRPERNPNVRHRQHVRLTARSVVWGRPES